MKTSNKILMISAILLLFSIAVIIVMIRFYIGQVPVSISKADNQFKNNIEAVLEENIRS